MYKDSKWDKQVVELKKEMEKVYKGYPLVGDYEVNSDIFEPKIQELIRYSIEDED